MFLLDNKDLFKIFVEVENKLLNTEKIKFERNQAWRKKHFQNVQGIYAIFEKDQLKYIGETGNLLKRMSDITRTINHSFRRKVGIEYFNGVILDRKFSDSNVEQSLDDYFDNKIYVTFVEVNFGRLEIETYLIDKHQNDLVNSEKKRKLKIDYDLIKDLTEA